MMGLQATSISSEIAAKHTVCAVHACRLNLLDQLPEALLSRHYSRSTGRAYRRWFKKRPFIVNREMSCEIKRLQRIHF
jgi:hypothetical protein